jgi:hypothetical protein
MITSLRAGADRTTEREREISDAAREGGTADRRTLDVQTLRLGQAVVLQGIAGR